MRALTIEAVRTASHWKEFRRLPWRVYRDDPNWVPAPGASERRLLDSLYAGDAKLADQVEKHMDESLPTIGAGAGVSDAVALLRTADALLVQEDGRPVGVLTRQDLLGFVARD